MQQPVRVHDVDSNGVTSTDLGGGKRGLDVACDIQSVSIPGSTSLSSGRKTVAAAGTAEAIGGDVDCLELFVVADPDNAGNIYLGGSGVDNTSGKLPPGGVMQCGPCNLSEVFIDADNSGEGISYFLVGE